MASSMNIVLLLVTVVATSYFGHATGNTGPVASLSLTGRVFCTINGNPDRSCGSQSCPPAVNATVVLAVREINVIVAQTTTNTTGGFQFNVNFNATTPAITLSQANQLVAYVTLPVAGCTSLSGAGILIGSLAERITSQTPLNVMLRLISFQRA